MNDGQHKHSAEKHAARSHDKNDGHRGSPGSGAAGQVGHAHLHAHSHGDVKPSSRAKYYCPMCEGVESDQPGDCPKCGMALERNPAYAEPARTIWTCPMHPQIEQDHPGACPICGMALEPKTVSAAGGEEDNAELRAMTRR